MSGPTATCELWVDGTRVADTGDDVVDGFVTALSGLSITWGRDGPNEQPGPASCVMDFLDPLGHDEILDVLHVGSVTEVWAEGDYTQDSEASWAETVDDPTFQTYPLGVTYDVFNLGASGLTSYPGRQIANVADRGHVAAVFMTGSTGNPRITMIMAPRPFTRTIDPPDAWDTIPRPPYGTTDKWRYRCLFKAPIGTTIMIYPCGHKAPYRTDYVTDQGYARTATGGWDAFEIEVKPVTRAADPAGYWQGLILVASAFINVWWRDQEGTWANQGARIWGDPGHVPEVMIDNLSIQQPGGSVVTRRVLVFSGSITDVAVTPAGTGSSTSIRATAMDLGAQLGNTVIGDSAWPANQWLGQRFDRILQLANIGGSRHIDDPLNTFRLSYQDVDAQPALGLLQDLAQTAGGVLWVATHAITGPFLWLENPALRASVQEFSETGGLIIITQSSRSDISVISACDLIEDGVTWRQDTADVITVVAVTWLEQGTDDEGQPTTTERTVTITDSEALATYGTRRLSVSTELINSADASSLANRILAQARAVAWRLDGLQVDTGVTKAWEVPSVDDATRQIGLLNLLDGTSRMGAALTLVDMPPYAPRGAISSVYVEGGRYDFTEGYWQLALTTSPSAGLGHSATWAEIGAAHPAWKWNQWDPSVQWVETYGVAV